MSLNAQMQMRTSLAALFLALLAGLAIACVPGVGIEGAPCPCPEGTTCCTSLSVCLSPESTCPQTYPPSSANDCDTDADCPLGELCQAWQLEDGTQAGPQQCRHDCADRSRVCAQAEICEPAPLDGRALSQVHIGWVCTPEQPLAGCQEQNCRRCEQAGGTFCNPSETEVLGCFLAVHPECGLTCAIVSVARCEEENSHCMVMSGGAICSIYQVDGDICSAFPCEACPGEGPGSLFCEANAVTTCAAVSVEPGMCESGHCSCDQACTRVELEACPASCSPDGGAHCLP